MVGNQLWKVLKLIHGIFTTTDQGKRVKHNCIPPEDFRHQDMVQSDSTAIIQRYYPELADLAATGLLEPSRILDACLAAPVPEVIFLLGTVHVAQQSAEDVRKTIQAIKPQLVVLELCASRMKALLVDPYANPLTDLEPCPRRAAYLEANRHKSIMSVLMAALSSRGHNILTAIMAGMYQLLESKLNVTAGLEFIAARATLIELLQQQQMELIRSQSGASTLLSILKMDSFILRRSSSGRKDADLLKSVKPTSSARASDASWSSVSAASSPTAGDEGKGLTASTPHCQEGDAADAPAGPPSDFEVVTVTERQQLREQSKGSSTWLQHCVAGDRPVLDTLLALWGSLKPVRRLQLMWDIITDLGSLADEETVAALGNEDMVQVLLKECGDAYPELMRPLVHDRNWLLATTAWRAAQHTAEPGQPVLAIVGRGHMAGMVYVTHRIVEHVALLSVRTAADQEEVAADGDPFEPLEEGQAAAEEAHEQQGQQGSADDMAAVEAMKTAPAVEDVTRLMRTADAPGAAAVHERNAHVNPFL
eukprot:gene8188-8379_t